MLAVFVNAAAVIIGSAIGLIFKSRIKQKYLDGIMTVMGLCTVVIGILNVIETKSVLLLIISMVSGTLIGELLNLEDRMNSVGDRLKKLTKNEGSFTDGFVGACILFCIGSMSIMGSIDAGINHNYTTIFSKSVMDGVSAIAFSAAFGIGVPFSALFIIVYQGAITLLSSVAAPFLTAEMITELSAAGGVILMGIGINISGISSKNIRVTNMLPAIFIPVIYYLIRRAAGI